MSEKIVPYMETRKNKLAVHFTNPQGEVVFVTFDPKVWGDKDDTSEMPQQWSVFKAPGETKKDVIIRICGSEE
jgi:hypothetical protein